MIITRTPLRISLGGGGTDLPSYYRRNGGGFLIAAAITKYVYIAVNRNFDGDLLLKYSRIERVAEPADVQHRLLREILLATRSRPTSRSRRWPTSRRAPASARQGRSPWVRQGTPRAQHEQASNAELAELACQIEIERLGSRSGSRTSTSRRSAASPPSSSDADDAVEVTGSSSRLDPRNRSRTTSCSSTPASGVRHPTCWRSSRPPTSAAVARREPRTR